MLPTAVPAVDAGILPSRHITCPEVPTAKRQEIATALTDRVVALFTPPRGPSAAEIRERTTVHFTPYRTAELFIGGSEDTGSPDVTVELSDWSMSVKQQRRVAEELTPLLVELFDTENDSVNFRFHSYPPTDFAVGGRLLSDHIPKIAQRAKKLFG